MRHQDMLVTELRRHPPLPESYMRREEEGFHGHSNEKLPLEKRVAKNA
jgi:hypothetical protein